MRIKEVKELKYLPKVFIDQNLNKIAITDKFENCSKYVSRSGASISGCLSITVFDNKVNIDETKEIRGIYYVPHDPIIKLEFRQKAIGTLDDIKQILSTIDFSKVSLKSHELLVKYDNYKLRIYDIYVKGKIYEFPVVVEQGNLKVFEVPPIKEAYGIIYQDGNPKEVIKEELFEKVKEVNIFNHKVIFETEVLLFKNFYITPGDGVLIFTPNSIKVELQSTDHEKKEFYAIHDTWLLFSHRRSNRFQD